MRTRVLVKAVLWGAVLLFPCLSTTTPLAAADGEEAKKEPKPIVDQTQVYFGKTNGCKAPAVVDVDRVFGAIPEYKRIKDEKLTEKDAEYTILLVRANRKFHAAVEAAATDGSYDLVANLGAVTWEGHVIPEITDQAIQKVGEQK